MAELFGKSQSSIARQIGIVFRNDGLDEKSNMQVLHNSLSKFKPTKIYNLKVVISVGYRVKSQRGLQLKLKNIYEQGELNYEATVRNFRTVQQEGDRMVERIRTYYNLDAIISVGFRVNARRGIKFRQWANVVIKNYIIRGYAINQQLLNVERHIDARLDSQQYSPVTLNICQRTHDRFLIIDDDVYAFGASLKDAGKRIPDH